MSKGTYLDEFAAVASLLLMASCILSFLSIRSKSDIRSYKFERLADLFFIIALTALAISIIIIVFLDIIG
ncbi:hypothetical protein [Elizabethkingia meningoseptica]|uniref:hypothetical protein n=1 Tax=Elizabethkingia meningoseptica TaxID=238 RepID=UPI003892AF91